MRSSWCRAGPSNIVGRGVEKLPSLSPKVPPARQEIAAPPPKRVDDFYKSPEFLEWRATVLRRAGYRCQAPGCNNSGRLFADHIVEIRDGGERLDPDNGQALCAEHHNRKTASEKARRLAEPIERGPR